jgi:hypothetical protein
MKRAFLAIFLLIALAATAIAQQPPVPVARIADDAKVIDRVAEKSKGDLPRDLLRRIVNEDIDLMRGKRSDGTFAYAGYERMEAARSSQAFSIESASEDRLTKVEIRGELSYRLTISLPQRRMLVTKNRPLWIENVEIEYIPPGSSETKRVNFPIKAQLEPGASRNIDLPDIGRQTTARVYARAAKDSGYGNLGLTLIQARVFDNPDSPYAEAVASAKAMLKALDHDDVNSLRSLAEALGSRLRPMVKTPAATVAATTAPSGSSIDVNAIPAVAPSVSAPPPEVYGELQAIEDLLTGSDAERRAGLDRLHQLLRKLRH